MAVVGNKGGDPRGFAEHCRYREGESSTDRIKKEGSGPERNGAGNEIRRAGGVLVVLGKLSRRLRDAEA